jgi:membrane-bound lytic murein transglycosylase B
VRFCGLYETALAKAEETYGVPASIIVATIGIETKYGQKTGDYRVIDSLSNIAFSNSQRAPFFRRELQEFLLLVREEHLDPLKVMGSYAGAIGQPQFMPSSYRHYAVNFSKSGKTDLMNDEIDVIGSIANFYSKHGWRKNEPVATEAMVLAGRYQFMMQKGELKRSLTLAELEKLGIVPKNKIEGDHLKAKVIELQSYYSKEYWLGFPNFFVIRRYNVSDLYAMAVYQLSTYISTLKNSEHLNNV